MEKRLAEKSHSCDVEAIIYPHATHYVFPESLLKKMFPIGSGLFLKMAFKAAKQYPNECKQARIDIERRIVDSIQKWKNS